MDQVESGLLYRMRRAKRQIADQHRHLKPIFRAFEEALQGGGARQAEDAFAGLQEALGAHFSLEDDVFFPALHGLHPQFNEALVQLSQEHLRFFEELQRLGEGLRASERSASAQAFRKFAERLGEHEAREEQLVGAITAL